MEKNRLMIKKLVQIEGNVKSEKRYAIYYAPQKGSSLTTFGQT